MDVFYDGQKFYILENQSFKAKNAGRVVPLLKHCSHLVKRDELLPAVRKFTKLSFTVYCTSRSIWSKTNSETDRNN